MTTTGNSFGRIAMASVSPASTPASKLRLATPYPTAAKTDSTPASQASFATSRRVSR